MSKKISAKGKAVAVPFQEEDSESSENSQVAYSLDSMEARLGILEAKFEAKFETVEIKLVHILESMKQDKIEAEAREERMMAIITKTMHGSMAPGAEEGIHQQLDKKMTELEERITSYLDNNATENEEVANKTMELIAQQTESTSDLKLQTSNITTTLEVLGNRIEAIEKNLVTHKGARAGTDMLSADDLFQQPHLVFEVKDKGIPERGGKQSKPEWMQLIETYESRPSEPRRTNVSDTLKGSDGDKDRPRPSDMLRDLEYNQDEVSVRDLRRDSVYGRLLEDGGPDTQGRGRLTLESDRHRDIVWKEKTVDGFMVFLSRIFHFTRSYDQKVPNIYTHVSEAIQQDLSGLLYMYKANKFRDLNDVYKANLQDIYQVTQILFAPSDLLHFTKSLAYSCNPYAVYMKFDDFSRARVALYLLRQKFRERYEFLVEGATMMKRKEALPQINFRPGGLLEIWFQLTPEQIRESFEKILQNKKRYYDSLQEFLEAYFDLVDDTYNRSEQVRVVNGRIKKIRQSFQMVDERGDIEADHYEQCEDEPEEEYEEDFDAVDQHRDARSSERSGSVQHQRYQGSYQQRNQRDQTVSGNDSNRRDRNHDKYSGRDHKWGGGNQFQRNQDMTRRPEREMDQRKVLEQRSELVERRRDITQPEGRRDFNTLCWKLLCDNKCVGDCKYLHTPSLLRAEQERLRKQWEQPRPRMNVNTTVQPPPGKPPAPYIHRIEDEVEAEEFGLVEGFMRVDKTNQFWRASHREARVTLPSQREKKSVKVVTLFDTGASGSNFASRRFVEDNDLQSHTVPKNKRVTVANGNMVIIDSCIDLEISFSFGAEEVMATLNFLVMEGLSLDLVIGLPDICRYYKEVLFHMMRDEQLFSVQKFSRIDPAVLEVAGKKPWKNPLLAEESEEERSIPQPESFRDGYIMGENIHDSVQHFRSEVSSRVDAGFLAATPVLQFLLEEGEDVFVPKSWTGINGVLPIPLEFKSNPPDRVMYEVFSDFCEWLIVVWDNRLICADVSCEYVR